MSLPTRDKIFISYSHKDQEWLVELLKTLKPFVADGTLTVWDDRKIPPAEEWEQQLWNAIDSSWLAVLLVTRNFLDSDFIMREELPKLLEAAGKKKLKITWVAVTSTLVKLTDISKKYQSLNNPDNPLDSLPPAEQGKALVDICTKLLNLASGRDERQPPPAEERTEREVAGPREETPTPVPPPPLPEPPEHGAAFWLKAGIVAGIAVAVFLLIALFIYYRQRGRVDPAAETRNTVPAAKTQNPAPATATLPPLRHLTLKIIRPDKNELVDVTYTVEWESPYPRKDWRHYILIQRPGHDAPDLVELSPTQFDGERWTGQARFGDQLIDRGKKFGVQVIVTQAVLTMQEIESLPGDAKKSELVTVKRR